MRIRFKANKKKDQALKPVLELQLRHGDVVTMCDTYLQAVTEVSSIASFEMS